MVFVFKCLMVIGFFGVDNLLFFGENICMFFGDVKDLLMSVVVEFKD